MDSDHTPSFPAEPIDPPSNEQSDDSSEVESDDDYNRYE